MKCVICKSDLIEPGTTTVTVSRDDSVTLIKNVPARICHNCQEAYFDAEVTKKLKEIADKAQESKTELAVLSYQ